MKIDLANESGFEIDEIRFCGLLNFLIQSLGVHPDAEISIVFATEEKMTTLHIEWMDEPGPTDVLSFPMDEVVPHSYVQGGDQEAPHLGDLVICPALARNQALHHSFGDEIEMLGTHGILHLLGFDHADLEEEQVMFGLQNELLAKWHLNSGNRS